MPNAPRKAALGQFYTTNYEYILTGMRVPADVARVVEPFCGEGHLLRFLECPEEHAIERYDIDPRTADTERRDSLLRPPDYTGAFVLTNPPFLARNKARDKAPFDRYGVNDLYKCFLKELCAQKCAGGILIVPLNFWCSIRRADTALRAAFLAAYAVSRINVFEERVFEDTGYTVCAFQFAPRAPDSPSAVPIVLFPSAARMSAELSAANDFLAGGDIYRLPTTGRRRVFRITSKNAEACGAARTRLRAKCVDDSAERCIALELVSPAAAEAAVDATPAQTARTYALLAVDPPIDEAAQARLAAAFNALLGAHRARHHSLFLANFRESTDVARKRISFDLVYRIAAHALDAMDAEDAEDAAPPLAAECETSESL